MKQHVAFIGTGIMGAHIANHMLTAGYQLTVYNRTKAKAQSLLDQGAQWAESVAQAVSQADVVFTMLGYPEDVEETYLGHGGILASTKPGVWMVDLTTSSPELARELHDAAEVEGKHALDCPVTGGESGAAAGTLTGIVGATEPDCAPIADLLATFTSKLFYMGGAGKGQLAKLCNQVSLAAAMVGYADAIMLAKSGDLDVEQTLAMISSGMGGSVALERLAPLSLSGDFKPRFMVEHLRKDLGLALATAENLEITLPSTDTAYTLYDLLCEVGGGKLGTQAITLLYADQATGEAAGLDWSVLDEQDAEHDHGHDHEHCDHEHHHHDGCEHDTHHHHHE